MRSLNGAALAALIGFCLASVYEISLVRLWAATILFALLGVTSRLSVRAERMESR
jgi:hypothetical protein